MKGKSNPNQLAHAHNAKTIAFKKDGRVRTVRPNKVFSDALHHLAARDDRSVRCTASKLVAKVDLASLNITDVVRNAIMQATLDELRATEQRLASANSRLAEAQQQMIITRVDEYQSVVPAVLACIVGVGVGAASAFALIL